MAEGPYIPLFDSIWDSPKIRRFATELRVHPDTAVAIFSRILMHARDNVETGDLGRVPARDLFQWARLGPETKVYRSGDALLPAMKLAKLVTDDEKAHIIGWEDGPGKLVALRRRERDRKAEARRRESEARSVKEAADRREQERRDRIEQASRDRLSGGQTPPAPTTQPSSVTASTSRALPEHSPSTPRALPEHSPVLDVVSGGQDAPKASPDAMERAALDVMSGARPLVKETKEIYTPPDRTERPGRTGGRTGSTAPSRPACGRPGCGDHAYLHASQSNDLSKSYIGDCASCARRGLSCDGYSATPIDPEIPDRPRASA